MTEDEVVLATIVLALEDEAFRKWRIAEYGRLVGPIEDNMYEIQDDGSLVRVASLWALGERSP